MVEWLVAELIRQQHEVILVAPPGSRIPGVRLIEARTREEALAMIPQDVDIVHFHGWPPSDDFALPYVFTLHGNEKNPESLPKNTVFISANHAARHGGVHFVYNGIDPGEFRFEREKKDFLLFFSKVRRRVKGARRALKLAKCERQSLVVAGGSRFDLLKVGGFWDSLRPGVQFLGEIGGVQKAKYFSEAKALVFPIDWEEPFGLVMIEALMSGTPVVATRRGSVPEIVHEKVGAIFETDDEFPRALAQALACSPEDCRYWAQENFSMQVCARNYLDLYGKYLSGDVVFKKLDAKL